MWRRPELHCGDQVSRVGGHCPASKGLVLRLEASDVRESSPATVPANFIKRNWHVCNNVCKIPSGRTRRIAVKDCRSRTQRTRRWSLEVVNQVVVHSFAGSLDARCESVGHSRGKWLEPFVDDGDIDQAESAVSSGQQSRACVMHIMDVEWREWERRPTQVCPGR